MGYPILSSAALVFLIILGLACILPLQLTHELQNFLLGDQIMTDSVSDILRTLIESVLGMRVSFGPQSAEVIHEKSGIVPSVNKLR